MKGSEELHIEFTKRRSIRKYKDIMIEKEKIDQIFEHVLISPSSRSRKPWEFIAVTDKSLLKELSESRQQGAAFIKNAPLAIVVVSDPEKCDVWIEDSTIAAYTIQLSAFSAGLGSCWVQVRDRMKTDMETSESYIKEVLRIPDHYKVECMIAIGYPNEEKEGYSKNDMDFSKVHTNKFTK